MFCKLPAMLLASALLAVADEPLTLPLWPNGAPGSEGQSSAEVVKDLSANGVVTRQISNIHNPSLIVYLPPKEKANGAAVIIAPGGGHQFLSIDLEGHEVARWLNSIGVAGIILKYRLARSPNSPYKVEEHALADGLRSVRLVRAHAKEWSIDPARVGMMGFSAGGEVASLVETRFDKGNDSATDPVERESSRPDFAILAYPGTRAEEVKIRPDTPPTFLVQAYDDRIGSERSAEYFLLLKKAGVPAELHIYRRGGHGFGMRDKGIPTSSWPARLADWMSDSGYLKASRRGAIQIACDRQANLPVGQAIVLCGLPGCASSRFLPSSKAKQTKLIANCPIVRPSSLFLLSKTMPGSAGIPSR